MRQVPASAWSLGPSSEQAAATAIVTHISETDPTWMYFMENPWGACTWRGVRSWTIRGERRQSALTQGGDVRRLHRAIQRTVRGHVQEISGADARVLQEWRQARDL